MTKLDVDVEEKDCLEDSLLLCLGGKENETNDKAHNKHAVREEIQTLRALAIISVLLFHLWDKTVPYGFLGVDVFFVISGYLMCRILSQKQPINISVILQFYERRFKRIVPLYLTVIAVTLMALCYFVASIQFHQIVGETLPAIFFVSNWPQTGHMDYFDMKSEYYFFNHTWSLSVELQFYFIVPLIFLLSDLLNAKSGRYSSVIALSLLISAICLSFVHQRNLRNHNAQHMALLGRIWQFFCGFLAHAVYSRTATKLDKILKASKLVYITSIAFLLSILLFDLPFFPSLHQKQINRLIITLLTAFIISRPNHLPVLMSNEVMVILGDISYSVYLVHWPLITWFRYSDTDSEKILLSAGLFLLSTSIFIGYCVEHFFKWFLKHIKTWPLLLLVISFAYCANSFLMLHLEENAVKMDSNQMLKDYTALFAKSKFQYASCGAQHSIFPTTFDINWKSFVRTRHCIAQGTGDKIFILIGNSHAVVNYHGIVEQFKDVYRSLFVLSRLSCIPITNAYKKVRRSENEKTECARFTSNYISIMDQWIGPIDTVIALFGIVGIPDVPIRGKLENDEIFTEMQFFYQNISRFPRDITIIQELGPEFRRPLFEVYMTKKQFGQNYMHLGDSRKNVLSEFLVVANSAGVKICGWNMTLGLLFDFQPSPKPPNLARMPMFRKRMKMLNCERCLKMNWVDDVWCGRNEDAYCPAVDQSNGLLEIRDTNHVTPLGANKQAKHMRKEYDAYMEKKQLG